MCAECKWQAVLDDIDDLITEDRYQFALDTLEGICEWVTDNEHVTDGQKIAIENIKASKNER